MKKFRLFPMILIICLVFSVAAPTAFALEEPNVPALAAVVVDLNTGKVLYEKNMNDQRAPASLTKVMTVLLALEAIDRGEASMDSIITAQDDCREGMAEDSSTSGIMPGTQVSMRELLYCAMIQSANEACNIIGEHLAGSISAWVERMNARAQELGCVNTHFVTTNGLSAEGHYSSAYDLYLITREALKFPVFLELSTTLEYTPQSPGVNGGETMYNSNALMTDKSIYGSQYVYEYAAGVKTGYTRAAGYCLISTAEKEGIHVLAVVMGCDGWFNAGIDEYKNFEASRNLYEWVFNNFSYQNLITAGQVIKQVDVELAQQGAKASLRPQEDVTVLLPNDVDMSTVHTDVTVYEDRLVAPLAAGVVLGEVNVTINGESYGTVKLVNTAAIELARGEFIRQRIAAVFHNGWVCAILIIVLLFLVGYTALVIRYRRLRRKHLKARKLAEKRRRERQMYREYDDFDDYR